MKHFVIASVLVLISTALIILGMQAANLLPDLASAEGTLVDLLFTWQIYVISFIFSLIVVFVLYGAFVFRRRPGDMGDGQYIKGNMPLEIAWTVIPFIVIMGFGVVSARHLSEMMAPAPDELVVDVTGFQFGWRFDYPQYGVSSSELYLPLGRKVLFNITSEDVIHSFWVVEFRIKQDAVPGRWTTLRVTPTELGDYRIRCAELCGYAHSSMYAPVVVVEPQQFEDWLAGKKVEAESPEATTPAAQGAQIAETRGCLSCHSVDGSVLVGPSWQGLFGSERQFEDGSTAIADEPYLRSSILNPAEQIVAGYPNVMPAAYSFLTDQEMAALIEYIKSLSE